MDEIKKQLAQLPKEAAEDLCVKEVTELCNDTNSSDLDMSLTEFTIRNAFGNGVSWAEAKAEEKEEEEAPTDCPICGRTLDDADYDFQICHHCGWDGNDKE